MKPYPEYKDSGNDLLGRIPAHWNVMRLKRLGSIRYGLGEPPDYTVDGVPLIRATNVSQGRVTPEKLVYVNPEDIPRARIYWLRLGDIVVVRSGALTGDSATIDDEFAGSIAGFDMVFRANATVYHGFIQYSLLSPHVRESQIDVVRTRAAQPHLNSEELGDCILGVPPEGEQCAIADYLDRETAEIDAFIADQEELIALLNERRTATITQSLISGLKPSVETKESEVDWLGRVPEHWAVTSLKHAIDILPGYAFGSEDFTTADEDVRLLRGVNINPGRIVWGDVVRFDARERPDLRTYELREGDLALGLDRPVISTGVRVARLGAEDIPSFVLQRVARIRAKGGTSLGFVLYLLQSEMFAGYLEPIFTGVSVPHMSPGQLGAFQVGLPPSAEQQQIADYLDRETAEIDAAIADAREAIALSKERRAAVISAAVTGKIDVRDHAKAGGNVGAA